MRAGVDAEHEGRGTRGRDAGEFVLARGELRDQFGGQVRLADVLGVVRGEMIPREAEGTDPQFGSIVDLTVGVQDRMAGGGGAADGVVLESRGRGAVGWELFEGGVQGADGGHASGGFEAGGGPNVEGEAGARGFFGVGHVPVITLHGGNFVVKLDLEMRFVDFYYFSCRYHTTVVVARLPLLAKDDFAAASYEANLQRSSSRYDTLRR